MDGEAGAYINTVYEKFGVKRLDTFPNGLQHLANNKREVKTVADMANLKMRAYGDTQMKLQRAFGADPVNMSWSELYSALQTGTVDGLDNAVFNYTNQGITDIITHITEINYCYSGGCFIAGAPFWNKLDDADKAIFAECAQTASDEFTKFFREKTDSMMKDGVAKGQWTVDQPSDAMKASLQEIYKQIWDESYDQYGKDIMDAIISGDYKTLSAK